MKILFDEHISCVHAEWCRSAGHDAVSILESGLAGANDETVRALAMREGRVLVTLDGDFGNILRFPPGDTPGVIWFRLHPPTEAAIRAALGRALHLLDDGSMRGRLAVVDADKIRLR